MQNYNAYFLLRFAGSRCNAAEMGATAHESDRVEKAHVARAQSFILQTCALFLDSAPFEVTSETKHNGRAVARKTPRHLISSQGGDVVGEAKGKPQTTMETHSDAAGSKGSEQRVRA